MVSSYHIIHGNVVMELNRKLVRPFPGQHGTASESITSDRSLVVLLWPKFWLLPLQAQVARCTGWLTVHSMVVWISWSRVTWEVAMVLHPKGHVQGLGFCMTCAPNKFCPTMIRIETRSY